MTNSCKIWRMLLLLPGLLSLCFAAAAETPGDCFDHLSSDDGLSSSYVRSLYRDSEGFVWIGTITGLDRFDGVEIRNFALSQPDGSKAKTSIADICGYEKDVLILSPNTLYEYDRTADSLFARYHTDNARTNTTVLVRAGDKRILIGTTRGLVVLDDRFACVQTLLPREHIVDMAAYGDDCIVLTPHNIYQLRTNEKEAGIQSLLPEEAGLTFSCAACVGNTIFAGTKFKGVYALTPETGEFNRIRQVRSDIITSLFTKSGQLYIGSDGMGMTRYTPATQKAIVYGNDPERKTSLASNAVYSLFVDDFEICWVGSYSHGLSYTSQNIHSFRLYQPLEGCSIRSFRITGPASVLAGTRNGLIYSVQGKNHSFRRDNFPPIRSNVILSLSHFGDGRYIIGTFGGGFYLFSTSDGSVDEYPLDQQAHDLLSKESVYGSVCRDGRIYLITLNGMFLLENSRIVKHCTEQNSPLPSSQLFSCLEDEQGIWIGTSQGLTRYEFDKEEFQEIRFSGMENDFRINYIYRDSRNDMWLCTNKYGLLKYRPDDDAPEKTGLTAGISPDQVSGIIESGDKQHYWISTSKGIYRYNSVTGGAKLFGKEQGLPNSSFCPGACQKVDDTYFFGSEEGLIYFTDAASSLPPVPRIVITDFLIQNERIGTSDPRMKQSGGEIPTIVIREGDEVQLRVVMPNFKDTRSKTFAYKLVPGMEDWSYTYDNTVTFKNSSKGDYSVIFRCSDDEITWSGSQQLLYIKVRRPFTRTFGFAATVTLAALGLFCTVWRKRKRLLDSIFKHSRDLRKRFQAPVREEAWMQEAINKIKQYMESEAPFANPDFSIKDLSDNVGFSIHQISHVLNSVMGTNFATFVNTYRIEAVKHILNSEVINRLTLFAIAEKCGFNSKTSFYRVFKNITGLTPLEYRKQSVGSVSSRDSD